jgi:pimeloyl-ACP methyl ester carboxylesterase
MTGIPVLFIPGNAGSHKQIRSIAAAAARSFYLTPGQPDEALRQQGARNLDFFAGVSSHRLSATAHVHAVDFNEDFSAFHGETMKEQTEYVCDALHYLLALYKQSSHKEASTVQSVVLIAHSMGGIIARSIFNHPNYPSGSVNTIITLSTPHMQPPAPFSRQIANLYASTNEFWRTSSTQADGPLANVALLSIAGGTSDTMIDSDTTHLHGLAPSSHGLSVFTTTIPDLYAPVDHLAIMWCDQLRIKLAKSILDIVDVQEPSRTKSVDKRLQVWRKHFVAGIGEQESTEDSRNFTKLVRGSSELQVQLPAPGNYVAFSSSRFEVKPCEANEECTPLDVDLLPLPPSTLNKATSNTDMPYWAASFSVDSKSSVISQDGAKSSFLLAELATRETHEWSILGLFLHTHRLVVSSSALTLHFPLLDSSLVAYTILVEKRLCESKLRLTAYLAAHLSFSRLSICACFTDQCRSVGGTTLLPERRFS